MTKRGREGSGSQGSEFVPLLDELIVSMCRKLLSSRKAFTHADLTKLLEVRNKLGGPVSQKSELWNLIERIRLEKGTEKPESATVAPPNPKRRTHGRSS